MDYLGINLPEFIKATGYLGISFIVFAETGLFLGFFLPGDSLLFIAGLLASQGFFSIFIILLVLFVSAILGNIFGYEFGRRIGPKLFNKEDSFIFKKKYVFQTQAFFEEHGKKSLILARFVPIVRTFIPILAGVGKMNFSTFLLYNIIGAFFWIIGLTLGGYFLGALIPDVDKYLLPIILGIIILSFLPAILHIYQEKKKSKDITETQQE